MRMRDQPRISVAGDFLSTRIMRHRYKDIRRHSRKDTGCESERDANIDDIPEGDAHVDEILEEIERLKEENRRLRKENEIFRKELEMKGLQIDSILEKNKILENRVKMNSTNSSKPPSTDGYRKPAPKSRRVKTGMKRGGQPGHAGHHMPVPEKSDELILHHPQKCEGCVRFKECSGTNFVCKESRFVVDIVMSKKVIEHRVLRAERCPLADGGDMPEGCFPEGVSAHVQYGDTVTAVTGLLSTHGAVSCSRVSGLMRDMFDITLSPGTVVSMVSRCARKVTPALETIKDEIEKSPIGHFDETGARTAGRLFWVHNSSTSEYTYQTISRKRGLEGMLDNGVLPRFKGTAIHDCLKTYWKFDMSHGICNAHILRELKGIEEMEPNHVWPRLFRLFLLSMKASREDAQGNGSDMLPIGQLREFDERFDRIMNLANRERPPPPADVKGKGKERALIERLSGLRAAVCLFIYDFEVPFDNNQAERDLRNVKTKVKVSGCFRSIGGGQDYLDVMSYLGTGRKHNVGAFPALMAAFDGNPQIVLQWS